MRNIILISFLILLSIASVCGQTVGDFEKKYGKGNFFEIRPTILMSAKFDSSSQVCEVNLQPLRFSEDVFHPQNNLIGTDILKEIVDELAPISMRGSKFAPFPISFDISGRIFGRSFIFDNIEVRTTKSIFIENDKASNDKTAKESNFGSAHIATIKWRKRHCVQDK